MLFRLGLLVVRFRWLVVVLWAVVLALALLFAPRASSVLKGGFGDADVESRRGLEIMTDRLGLPEASLNVVFSSPTLEATDPAFVEEMQRVLRPLEALPEVPRVITHYGSGNPALISRDGQAAMALVFLDVGIDEAIHRYKEFRARISSDSLDIQVTGGVPIFSDLNDASTRDLRRAEIIVFPLVLVALVVVFGSVVAAGLPLAMGGLAVAVTLALIYGVAQLIDVSIFVLNITTLLGVGIAIDYSLLVVSRFREELLSRPRDEAVAVTVATAGRTLFFSGLTSAAGFSGLFLFEYMMLRSLGVGGILVVLLSMALSLTLLPALLAILGHRVNALAVLPARPDRAGVWGRVARGVMRHPVLVSAPIVVGLLVLGLPFLDVKLGAPWASILPQESEARRGWDSLSERFGPGAASPILAVVTAPVPIGQAPDLVGRLYDYTRVLQDDPRVERVESIVTVRPEITKAQYQRIYAEPALVPFPPTGDILPRLAYGDTTVLRIFEAQAPLSDTSKELVRHIRATAPGDGVEVYVTGATADIMDAVDVMYRDFPKVIAYILATTFLALLWLFRSLVLPLKAVLLNGLSVFASYGALVFVFQQGHFQGLLGFTAQGVTEVTVPILMFCLLFGISMDYEIFLLSRIREFYAETGDTAASVVMGLERTGRVITSSSLILVMVLAAIATGDVVLVKGLGVGMAVAIFLDATLVRVLLVPALMQALGRWNWWPSNPVSRESGAT